MALFKKNLHPEFQCPRCSFAFSGRPERCPNCGLIFTWNTYDQKYSTSKNRKTNSRNEVIENLSLQRIIPLCKEWKIDTLFVTTAKSCKTCGIYSHKVYSLYGWNKQYPPLPNILFNRKCPNCSNIIGISIYFPGMNSF